MTYYPQFKICTVYTEQPYLLTTDHTIIDTEVLKEAIRNGKSTAGEYRPTAASSKEAINQFRSV